MSGSSAFPPDCTGTQTGINYLNSAVEPSAAVDPTDPQHLIGVWQQDRWSNGAASGILTAVSTDRGRSWTNVGGPSFSRCSGGTFARASDPWVTISPNGTAYQSAIVTDDLVNPAGLLVSRSTNGGFVWSDPSIVIQSNFGDDKASITADPTDSNYVYVVWDQTNRFSDRAQSLFSRTSDGGNTWEAARLMYDPGSNGFTGCNQIVVLPTGTLIDVFCVAYSNGTYVATLRSTDHGDTWSTPTIVSEDDAIGVVDARTQGFVRTGNGIPSLAVDPSSGAIYITWEDARFSARQREGVVLVKSTDGGISWSAPVQVNRIPEVQAFNPTVAVNSAGVVAITYYDFRQATADVTSLATSYWQIVSSDGGSTWTETSVTDPFDMLRAPLSGKAHFLGDYQALVPAGATFIPFFMASNPAGNSVPTSVYARFSERAGNPMWNGHIEINYNPRPRRPKGR